MKEGIMSKGERKEQNWKKVSFKEPYADATKKFREEVEPRADFDPAALYQFSIFMAKSVLQMLEDVEENFGPEGQKICNEALIKVGRDIATQIFSGIDTTGIPDIELVSFIATKINTVCWASIEDPRIINEEKCEFDILWCPLEDVYKAFDCRIQRYLVQGILDQVREMYPNVDFDVEFLSTIPAGAKTCLFQVTKRRAGAPDKWALYSELLEKRALKRWNAKKKRDIGNSEIQ